MDYTNSKASRQAGASRNGHTNGKAKAATGRPVFRYRDGWPARVPEILRERDQWVCWRFEQREGKWTKAPLKAHAPSQRASSTDPQDWNTFETAAAAYEAARGTRTAVDGVGFVFAHGGDLVGFDLDAVVLGDGAIDPWGAELLGQLAPTYHEISPSGKGIKGIVKGELPGPGINRRGLGPDCRFGFEMYSSGRFFTITGESLDEDAGIADRSDVVRELYGRFKTERRDQGEASSGPPLAGDDELLDRARNAKNGAAFASLFEGKIPPRSSPSEADFQLCCRLAFWFNRDPVAIDRVFRRSGLMRDKWDSPRGDTTYGAYTIANAIGITEEVYAPSGSGESDGRAIIDLTSDFHLTVDASKKALGSHDDIYQRAQELVHVARHQPATEREQTKGLRRSSGSPLIVPLGPATVRTMLSRVAKFRRWDQREQEWGWKAPPRDIAESILGERNYPDMRELVGVIEAPTLRPDGSLLREPGYDAATGLLYVPGGIYPETPDWPTEEQVGAAKDELLYLVADFPFKSDSDRAAWLSSVLTLVARGGIDGPVPGYLVSANVAGSGKSWLATLAGIIATGRAPSMSSYADDTNEMEKTLVGIALAGDRCVVFDNAANGSAIGSPALDRAILARGSFSGRILGQNRQSPNIPWSATIYVTGNNICTRDDSLRRFVSIFLEYGDVKPETRDPKAYRVYREHGLDLQAYVMRERPKLVAACLTILRGFIVAEPAWANLTAMDFPEWDHLIRRAVYFATGHDPLGSHSELESEDETTGERIRLVNAWRGLCNASGHPEGLTTEQANGFLLKLEGDLEHRPLIETFAFWAKGGTRIPNARTLGYLLRRHRNAASPVGKLRSDSVHAGVKRWFVS
jgi:primase-polymerase (primpol)-like protein